MSLFHKVINFIENNLLYTNSAIKCVTICTPPQKKINLDPYFMPYSSP